MMFGIFANMVKKFSPDLFHPCPYSVSKVLKFCFFSIINFKGHINFTLADDITSWKYVIPRGTFKFDYRVDEGKKMLYTGTATVDIKSEMLTTFG